MSDAARSADAERFPTGAAPAAPTPETTLLLAREGNDSADHLTARCREAVQCPPAALLQAIRARLGQYLDHPEVAAGLKPMEEWSLAAQGRLAETDILQAYTVASGLGVLEEEELELAQKHPDVSLEFLTEHLCLPLLWDAEAITLAVATPYQLGALSFRWRQLFGLKSRFILCRRSQLERSLVALYEGRGDEGGLDKLDLQGDASEETLRDLALEAPIVRLVNDMFTRAIEMGASDIHVEPAEETLGIRFRVDGILQTVSNPPIASFPAISSRLKLIGGLNIAERRLPQDGRTDLRVGRHQVDIRISTVPALHGESIVLRLLPKDIVSYSVERLGMAEAMRTRFESLIALPHGMILVVGPTGSGKTTTLYCAMRLLNHDDVKIITIEDPIEYQIGGVTQIQVKPSIGLTFAGGLRHIVRQDPDIILVGEIRDRETAEIAIHAALTGHLVLSTLHTNDATGAISRLLDMGVEDFLLSSALVGVLSQRLVRRICETCKGSGVAAEVAASGNKNCRTCSGSGFRGRVGIFELLLMDDELRQGIRQGLDNAALATIARQHGMKSLREDGERLIGLHITTREEVARVCQLDT